MTDDEETIILKAYAKAIEGGYPAPGDIAIAPPDFIELVKLRMFAKAIWGDDAPAYPLTAGDWDLGEFTGPYWQYQLQQMIVAPDPIEYLGDNL